MEGNVDDAGAFCAALADRVEGKGWRSAARKEASQNFKPGDYIYQQLVEDNSIYARVISELKNGAYKVVAIGGWSRGAVIKSTKGWYPQPKLIKESDVPDKYRKAIAKKYNKYKSASDGDTRITKNTVKAVLRRLGLLKQAKITGQDVEFWPEDFSDDWHEGYDMAESAAKAFAEAMGDLSIWTNHSYFRVRYKGEFLDMGDWNMPSSRWHY
jgi:hypothetical protein